jgi:TOBE domain
MRPPDIHIVPDSDNTGTEALVARLARTGSGVRVSLRLHDGNDASVLLTAEEAEQLELAEGQIVAVSVA